VWWHIGWTKLTYGLLVAWFYESDDGARRMTVALRQSELARRSAERWVLELKLNALQARVEPRVLFETLDEAGRAFRSRPLAAEQLIEQLIDYLRRALPKLAPAECTLGRESDLALSYAHLLRGADTGRLVVEESIEPPLREARFVPMLLQPLCDALLRPALANGGSARLSISARRDGGRAQLTVRVGPGGAPVSSERLGDAQRTLDAMFAPHARIERIEVPGGSGVSMEIPYVAAPRADR
jgi:LytS/YehU family sensor histidine kinase